MRETVTSRGSSLPSAAADSGFEGDAVGAVAVSLDEVVGEAKLSPSFCCSTCRSSPLAAMSFTMSQPPMSSPYSEIARLQSADIG